MKSDIVYVIRDELSQIGYTPMPAESRLDALLTDYLAYENETLFENDYVLNVYIANDYKAWAERLDKIKGNEISLRELYDIVKALDN